MLLLAVGLRFAGLGWGLRHEPHIDERVFVEAVEQMLVERDLDHRFYQYPGLMFYLLAPVLAVADPPPFGPTAYLAARGVIAAFGVLGVFLAWRLGRHLGGERGGLLAALLLAVSPADVHTAHMLRPDVALQALALLVLLACLRIGQRVRDDACVGAWLGAALALKFTAVFLGPVYLVVRLRQPGPRVRGLAVATVAAAVAFALLSPYALLHLQDFTGGVREQVVHHYQGQETPASSLSFYVGHLWRTLGPVAAALVALGAWLRRREPLTAAVLVQLAVTLAVMSSADTRFMRHLLPVMGGLVALAGVGFGALVERQPRLALATVLAVALPPAWRSADYLHDVVRPSTWDRSADWIAAHVPDGGTVLTSVPLGLETGRIEVLRASQDSDLDRRLALEADVVAWDEGFDPAVIAGFERRHVVEPYGRANGNRAVLATAPEALRPRYERLFPAESWLSSSEPGLSLAALVDRDATTRVRIPPRDAPRWIQVDLPESRRIGRVELLLGAEARTARAGVELLLHTPAGGWERVRSVDGRPHPAMQWRGRELSRLMLLAPAEADGLRLRYTGARVWPLAGIEIDAIAR